MQGETAEESFSNVRANLTEVVNAVTTRGRITYITSRGHRVAIIAPVELGDAATQVGGSDKAAALLQNATGRPAKDNPIRLSGEVLWATNSDLAMRLIAEVLRRTGHREARIEALNVLLNDAVTEYLDRIEAEDDPDAAAKILERERDASG